MNALLKRTLVENDVIIDKFNSLQEIIKFKGGLEVKTLFNKMKTNNKVAYYNLMEIDSKNVLHDYLRIIRFLWSLENVKQLSAKEIAKMLDISESEYRSYQNLRVIIPGHVLFRIQKLQKEITIS